MVSVPHALAPCGLKLTLTCQSTLVLDSPALADLMSLPSTTDVASAYLYGTPLIVPHETVWLFGLLYWVPV